MIPVVAIIGRPNVGKSTLFNRIANKNIAIVDDLPGVTRDRNYLDITYNDKSFILVDTGGFDPFDEDKLAGMVKEQAQIAAEEADIIIFLMDGQTGLHHSDTEINRVIQRVLFRHFQIEVKMTIQLPHQEEEFCHIRTHFVHHLF